MNDYVEYTSDSETDELNVRQNRYEITQGSLQSIESRNDEINAIQEANAEVEEQSEVEPNLQPDRNAEVHLQQPEENDEVHHQEQNDEGQHMERNADVQHQEPDENGEIQQQEMDRNAELQVDEEDEEMEFDSSESDEQPMEEEEEDYDTVLNDLKSQWLLMEMEHSVSKTASENFWKLGMQNFPKLQRANRRGRKRKTSLFKTIRRNMYTDLLPEIELTIAYKNRETGEVKIVSEKNTPLKQYSPAKFDKLYEIGTLKVIYDSISNKHFIFLNVP